MLGKRTVVLVVLVVGCVGVTWWLGVRDLGPKQSKRRQARLTAMEPRAIGQGRLIGWWPAAPDQLGVTAVV
ncbi:MAG TPA: hypothetical protein DCE43_16585, partial [Planctomycetaceae bacterium]|nr:hypothetical protein [Planctomycetaceae bacterium]